MNHLSYLQAIEKKWSDILGELTVSHDFLSYFISEDVITVNEASEMMKVTAGPTFTNTDKYIEAETKWPPFRICLNKMVWISIKFLVKFVPNDPINNIPTLVQIMAWHGRDDKALSELMVA